MLNQREPRSPVRIISAIVAVVTLFVLAVLFVVAFTIDGEWDVEESVYVEVPSNKIVPLVNSVIAWERWSVWNQVDMPGLEREFKGPAEGVGSTVVWDRGLISGVTRISNIAQDQQIAFSISFDQRLEFAEGRIVLRYADGGTEIFMRIRGNTGTDPFAKLAVMWYHDDLEREVVQSLNRLRDKLNSSFAVPTPSR